MSDRADQGKKLNQFRIRWLYQQSQAVKVAGLINALIYIFVSLGVVSNTSLIAWGIIFLLIQGARIGLWYYFDKKIIKVDRIINARRWEYIFAFSTFLSGVMWGVAGSFLLPSNAFQHQAFLGFLLAGTTAGAAVSYCTSTIATQAFLLPALLPFVVMLLREGEKFELTMALLVTLYFILVTTLMKRMKEYVLDSISLGFEKDALFKELQNAQSKITYSAKMAALGEMAGGISHEINNPLTVIQGSIQLLRESAADAVLNPNLVIHVASKIENMAERISKIIAGLRSFARDGEKDPLVEMPIRSLIYETLAFCGTRFKNHGIGLIVDEIPEDLFVKCRSVELSQVLLNLLNNSFDAIVNSPNSWVKIDVKEKDGVLQVGVSDSGKGIPKEIHQQIMTPFFTTKDVGKGTGLGLSISKGLMESQGGALYLDEQSPNTRFVFSLPTKKIA